MENKKIVIFIVEDDESVRENLKNNLNNFKIKTSEDDQFEVLVKEYKSVHDIELILERDSELESYLKIGVFDLVRKGDIPSKKENKNKNNYSLSKKYDETKEYYTRRAINFLNNEIITLYNNHKINYIIITKVVKYCEANKKLERFETYLEILNKLFKKLNCDSYIVHKDPTIEGDYSVAGEGIVNDTVISDVKSKLNTLIKKLKENNYENYDDVERIDFKKEYSNIK
ncbi:MAG: hypothetical protein LBR74_06715 [Eubacterium sp.]|jgi:hypothetical protein|nr:hypothetical protein [Eubacterium sp.]